jgi:HJR/Mrr/RecB family endonuclease
MFKKHSLQVKVVKDTPKNPTLMDEINAMSPQELEEFNARLMKRLAINIGAVIVVKVAVAITLNAVVKHIESK